MFKSSTIFAKATAVLLKASRGPDSAKRANYSEGIQWCDAYVHDMRDTRDQRDDLVTMIVCFTTTPSEDREMLLSICERASASEASAKEATEALRRVFTYGDASQQFSATSLWADMLLYSSELFLCQCAKPEFLDTLEDVLNSQSTSRVVRERLLEVLADAVYASSRTSYQGVLSSFGVLLRKVKSVEKPVEECCICMDSIPVGSIVHVNSCGHTFCRQCLHEHISARVDELIFPIHCPACTVAKGKLEVKESASMISRSPWPDPNFGPADSYPPSMKPHSLHATETSEIVSLLDDMRLQHEFDDEDCALPLQRAEQPELVDFQRLFECSICMDDVPMDSIALFDSCGHTFCHECLREYVTACLEERGFPLHCPACTAAKGKGKENASVISQSPDLNFGPADSYPPTMKPHSPHATAPSEMDSMQYAMRLQREYDDEECAISLQRAELFATGNFNSFECRICLDDLVLDSIALVDSCGHAFCHECLRGYVAACLEEHGFPLHCPACTAAKGKGKENANVISQSPDLNFGPTDSYPPSITSMKPHSLHATAPSEMDSMQYATRLQRAFDEEDRSLSLQRAELVNFAQPLFECSICMDDVPMDSIARIDSCGHTFCRECLRRHIAACLEEHRFPVLCPTCTASKGKGKDETGEVSQSLALELGLTDEQFTIWTEMEMVAFSILLHCRMCQRSMFVARDEHDDASVIECPLPDCDHMWCKHCQQSIDFNGPRHSCDGTSELDHLVKAQGWKYCPTCKTPIQKTSGCNHMTCITPACNTHFCYLCGELIVKSASSGEINEATSNHYRNTCSLFEVPE